MSIRPFVAAFVCLCALAGCNGSSSNAADKSGNAVAGSQSHDTADNQTNESSPSSAKAPTNASDSKQGNLVGIWDFKVSATTKSATYEFKNDGTLEVNVVGPTPDGKGTFTLTIHQRYKLDGQNLTMTPIRFEMETDETSQQNAVKKQEKLKNDSIKRAKPVLALVVWNDPNDCSLLVNEGAGDGPRAQRTVALTRHAG